MTDNSHAECCEAPAVDAVDVITSALMGITSQTTERDSARLILSALERGGFVVLDQCARCGEDPRAHWCADLEETFN